MEKKLVIIFVAVALVVGGGIGYGIGKGSATTKKATVGIRPPVGVALPGVSGGSVVGTIESLNGETVVVKLTGTKAGQLKEIITSSSTTVVRMERKATDVFQKEMSAYQAALAKFQKNPEGGVAPTMPVRTIEKAASMKDLTVGVRINTQTKDADVSSDKVEAVKIIIQLAAVQTVPVGVPPVPSQ